MIFQKGVHLYINIQNLADVIDRVGNDTYLVNKVFYGIDLYNHNMETYISNLAGVRIEKLTGSRIHIILDDCLDLPNKFFDIAAYSFSLISILNEDARLSSLPDFELNAGADFGNYLDWPISYMNVMENNTIGIPASRAAKIQAKAGSGKMIITDSLFQRLGNNVLFNEVVAPQQDALDSFYSIRQKYRGIRLYEISFSKFGRFLNEATDMQFSKFRNNYHSFQKGSTLSEALAMFIKDRTYSNPTKEKGFVFYSDIRGSTKLLEGNPTRLVEVSNKLMNEVDNMIKQVYDNSLIHVQVQGDRESCVGYSLKDCGLEKVALKIISAGFSILSHSSNNHFIDDQPLAVGIGVSFGDFYKSVVSKDKRDDNLILGRTVINADEAEDIGAAANNTFALDESAFRYISSTEDKAFNKAIKEKFVSKAGYYVSNCSEQEFFDRLSTLNREENYEQSKQNRAKPYLK
jgi:class 3 adenylate cyclase